MCIFSCHWPQFAAQSFSPDLSNVKVENNECRKERVSFYTALLACFYSQKCIMVSHDNVAVLSLLPVCHRRALSLALGQGEATFSQVELQSASLHQPVRRLQDLRGQGLWFGPLVQGLAAPGSRFGHDTPWGGRCLGLLTDAIEVFHWVFASFTSSASTAAGEHCYLQSSAADWWKSFLPFARFCLLHLLWAKAASELETKQGSAILIEIREDLKHPARGCQTSNRWKQELKAPVKYQKVLIAPLWSLNPK